MTLAVRSESRVIRPFSIDRTLEEAFEAVTVKLANVGDAGERDAILDDFAVPGAVSVFVPLDLEALSQALSESGLDDSWVDLVLTVRSHMFKRTSEIAREDFASLEDTNEWALNPEGQAEEFLDPRGFTLTVALVLNTALEPADNTPELEGTWLARREFFFGPTKILGSFVPRPLTAEVRKEFGLAAETFSYVRVSEDLFELDSMDEAFQIYLDSECAALMAATPDDPMNKMLQQRLILDAVGQVLAATFNQWHDTEHGDLTAASLGSGSAISRFLSSLASQMKMSLDEFCGLYQAEPTKVLALYQACLKDKSEVRKALGNV